MTDCLLNSGYALGCGVSGGAKVVWLANFVTNNKYVKDTGDANGSYTVVADGGGGLITITADNGSGGHGLTVGTVVELSGGAYDGLYEVKATPTASTFQVEATFTATDAGSYGWNPDSNVIIGTSNAEGTALTFFKFEQELETIEVAETGTGSREAGTFFADQTINLVLYASKDQASEDARRSLVQKLLKGRFVAVVRDNNGVKRVYGAQNGLKLSEGSQDSGKALADLSGFTFALNGKEPELSFVYDDTGDSSGAPAEAFTAFTLPA